mgnify:FL=1
MKKRIIIPAALLALTIGLSACGEERKSDDNGGGSDSTEAPAPSGDAIQVVAKEFAFDPTEIQVASGQFTIDLVNQGAIEHNFTVEGVDTVIAATARQTASASYDLEPGTYRVICTIAGHEAAGMVASLVVG